jgi:hypothetical protein
MNQSPYRHYVYILSDPRNSQPFYIGKGTAYRYKAHETEARMGNDTINKAKCDLIREIWESGNNISYELLPCDTHELTFDKEQELIRLYGRRINGSGILLNVDQGGRDRWRPKTSNRTLYVYDRQGHLQHTFPSARTAATFFQCNPSVVSSAGRRVKLFRDLWILTYQQQDSSFIQNIVTTSRPAKRRVAQCSLTGEVITTHQSTYEAGRVCGLREDGVYSTLREFDIGKRKTATYGGFLWKWAD